MKLLLKITISVLLCWYPAHGLLNDCLNKLKIENVDIYQIEIDKYRVDSTVLGYWISKQLNDYGIKDSVAKKGIYLSIKISTIEVQENNVLIYSTRTEVLKRLGDGSFLRYFYTDDYGLVSVDTYKEDIQKSIKDQVNSFIHFWVQANNSK